MSEKKQRTPLGINLHPPYRPEIYLEKATTRQDTLAREHQGPRAILNAIERLVKGYSIECTSVRQDMAIAEAQLRDYQACLGTHFPHDAYLSGLTALRDQLKAGLSGTIPEPGAEPQTSVSERAEQIKALKAAHTLLFPSSSTRRPIGFSPK